jgi:hypothetical protein
MILKKKLLLVVTVIFALAGNIAFAKSLPHKISETERAEFRKQFGLLSGAKFSLKRGVDIAIACADIAYQRRGLRVYKRLSKTMQKINSYGGFVIRENKSEVCNEGNVLAFTECPGGENIYVCRRSLNKYTLEDLVMTLLHETGHVIGYCDECKAEWLSKYAYEFGSRRNFKPGYTECFE